MHWTDHSCHRRKLVGKRHRLGVVDLELTFADHVHQPNSSQHRTGGRNDLKLSLGLVTRLWRDGPAMLLRYLAWRTTIGTSRPALTSSMVDRHATLFHHLLEVPVTELIGCIPIFFFQGSFLQVFKPTTPAPSDAAWKQQLGCVNHPPVQF